LDHAVTVWHAQHANPDVVDLGIPMTDSAMILNELSAYMNNTDKWLGTTSQGTYSSGRTAARHCGWRWM
jgi:hypothetical protein